MGVRPGRMVDKLDKGCLRWRWQAVEKEKRPQGRFMDVLEEDKVVVMRVEAGEAACGQQPRKDRNILVVIVAVKIIVIIIRIIIIISTSNGSSDRCGGSRVSTTSRIMGHLTKSI